MAKKRSLKEYRAKRDFTVSPEPSGTARAAHVSKRPASKLIFCVQKHLASHLHYDFRLEHNGVMLSWAVPKGPSLNPADKRLAMQVEDHPRDYADFEGVIPSGYGAGVVMLWDYGTWEPPGDINEGLEKGHFKFTLNGTKLKGSWAFARLGRTFGSKPQWLLIKHKDEWAGTLDILTFAPLSVKSGQDFKGILAKGYPEEWKVAPPAKGGEAGKMYATLLAKLRPKKPAKKNLWVSNKA
ncbi:MAG TPA: DNA polymerase ligase N-terminal domain-containing protein [Planctomycetota bacterium]|nr:DNA polymerase ligase N-terminal domain-containing protein [Planctomycetota bacterium]